MSETRASAVNGSDVDAVEVGVVETGESGERGGREGGDVHFGLIARG